ncbi:MAG: CopG family transcriptional regulator [Ruminiclostridium sp.]|nr:CopG family transcriptional regulator [Ruminiclostridium sp.]
MNKKLIISKRSKIKGEDGYKTFSLRIKDEVVAELDRIAEETGRSRNEIISLMLDFGIENCEITENN